MRSRIEVYVERRVYRQTFAFTMFAKTGNNISAARNVVFEDIEEGTEAAPAFELDYYDAQSFLDELYRQGLRPTDIHQTEGEKEAMEANLVDLRKVLDAVVEGFTTKKQI